MSIEKIKRAASNNRCIEKQDKIQTASRAYYASKRILKNKAVTQKIKIKVYV